MNRDMNKQSKVYNLLDDISNDSATKDTEGKDNYYQCSNLSRLSSISTSFRTRLTRQQLQELMKNCHHSNKRLQRARLWKAKHNGNLYKPKVKPTIHIDLLRRPDQLRTLVQRTNKRKKLRRFTKRSSNQTIAERKQNIESRNKRWSRGEYSDDESEAAEFNFDFLTHEQQHSSPQRCSEISM